MSTIYKHEIDLNKVAELAAVNTYWSSVKQFLIDLENKGHNNITPRQESWLTKIEANHVEQHKKLCQ